MRYYGIVSRLNQEPGWYGRRVPNTADIQQVQGSLEASVLRALLAESEKSGLGTTIPILLTAAASPIAAAALGFTWFAFRKQVPVNPLMKVRDTNDEDLILVSDRLLADDYRLGAHDTKLLHGLIPDENRFRTIMRSEGGSEFLVLTRDHARKLGLKHPGGERGEFSPGVYCEHPKDASVLLPLQSAASYLQTEILQETVGAFEALGATKILIEDVTELEATAGGGDDEVKAKGRVKVEKKRLSEARYEPTVAVDKRRALAGKRHIHDLPNVMSVIHARTDGNQTYQRFEDTVAVNCGLDVSVLDVFSAKAKVNYSRRWLFEVEFLSKARLPTAPA